MSVMKDLTKLTKTDVTFDKPRKVEIGNRIYIEKFLARDKKVRYQLIMDDPYRKDGCHLVVLLDETSPSGMLIQAGEAVKGIYENAGERISKEIICGYWTGTKGGVL